MAEWSMEKAAPTGKLILRGDTEDAEFLAAAAKALGMAIPTAPCTANAAEGRQVLWLGPNEWLVTTPPGQQGALACPGLVVTDITDGRTVFRLSGPRAPDVLAKGCPLDFYPRGFAAGAVKRSLLARVDVILHHMAEDAPHEPVYEIYVARSFAAYLWDWLVDAAREYDGET